MNANAATPVSIAAMPARRSCLMPKATDSHWRAAAGNSPASPIARSMNRRFAIVERFTQGMPRCASCGDAAAAARQQPVEHVDGAAHQIVLAAPPAFVAPQDALRARIFALRQALGEHIGQRRRIEQAEVRALPRERMHDVRGIADQRHPRGDVVLGLQPPQRKLQSLAREPHLAQRAVEIRFELAFECFGRDGQQFLGARRRQRPDDGAARRPSSGRNASVPSPRNRCHAVC